MDQGRNPKCSKCVKTLKTYAGRISHEESKHGYFDETLVNYSCQKCGCQRKRPSSTLTHEQSCSVSASPLCRLRSDAEIDCYMKSYVYPTPEDETKTSSAVDDIVQFLYKNLTGRLTPKRILKSGSLAKGTTVKGKSDIDLILFLVRFDNVRSLVVEMDGILRDLKTCLESGDYHVDKCTKHSVQVELAVGGDTHDVDILPAVDLVEQDCSLTSVYKKMAGEDKDIIEFYSASFAPLQVTFVQKTPGHVNNLIRIVKSWKKDTMQKDGKTSWPTSYVFELIAICVWRHEGAQTGFNLRHTFYKVLKQLGNYRSLRYIFQNENYERSIAGGKKRYGKYYVVDPANPFNNVMKRFRDAWPKVAKKARHAMQQPIFNDIPTYQR